MTLPGLVRLERYGDTARITIDGEDFPWAVSKEAVATVDADGVPSLELTLLARRVEVVDELPSHPRGGAPEGA